MSTPRELFDEGVRLFKGAGVPKDQAGAMELFTEAATQGLPEAQTFLGSCYEKGFGVTADHEEAAYWYERAALQGFVQAQYCFASCYENSIGLPKDTVKAAQWYRRAWENGFAPAKEALDRCLISEREKATAPQDSNYSSMTPDRLFDEGTRYFSGTGVQKDRIKAHDIYLMAAEKGHEEAQYTLGLMYRTGTYGPPRDHGKAMVWYEKAAAQGNTDAIHEAGICYHKMNDSRKAATYYRNAAEKGHAQAQNDLGKCYAIGDGVQQDRKEAEQWFRKAASQGNTDAQENLRTLLK